MRRWRSACDFPEESRLPALWDPEVLPKYWQNASLSTTEPQSVPVLQLLLMWLLWLMTAQGIAHEDVQGKMALWSTHQESSPA